MSEEDFTKILAYFRGRERRSAFYGEWVSSDDAAHWRRMAEMVEDYFVSCDNYDARVCTGLYKGEPMPATPDESRLINQHSWQVRSELRAKYNVTDEEFHQAIREYKRT